MPWSVGGPHERSGDEVVTGRRQRVTTDPMDRIARATRLGGGTDQLLALPATTPGPHPVLGQMGREKAVLLAPATTPRGPSIR